MERMTDRADVDAPAVKGPNDLLEGLEVGQVKSVIGFNCKITDVLRVNECFRGEWAGNASEPRVFATSVGPDGDLKRHCFKGHEINFLRRYDF